MPDLTGKTAVVTGANSGLGYEVTRALAGKGARVVMACRDEGRGEDARRRIEAESPPGSLDVRTLDLAALDSIREFSAELTGDLHVLCNNAGVMAIPRRQTADGFEYQFGVNHLGHFALTGLLLDRLRRTSGETRVVTQSSGLHERGELDVDGLRSANRASGSDGRGGERDYDPWNAYARSKLANVLFAYELQRRLEASGVEDVLSVACHPGYADTALQRRGPEERGSVLRLWLTRIANAVFAQSAERGALPMLYAATADAIEGGSYVGPGGVMNMRGAPERQRSSQRSYDRDLARRLWALSTELTGVSYGLDAPPAAG